jgi:hypothetical protein
MDGGAPVLDCDDRIECAHCSLEGFEVPVLIREHAETARIYTQANTGLYIFL